MLHNSTSVLIKKIDHNFLNIYKYERAMFETIVKINDYSETTTEEVNYITTGSINNLKWICSVEVLN